GLGRKEGVGNGVCNKLPLLSPMGRAQERKGAKERQSKEGSTGKKDCQSEGKKRGRKDNQASWGSNFSPLALLPSLHPFVPSLPLSLSSCSVVILGTQVIDLMMLVVDVVKGVQTQTAECLLIGEQTAIDKMTKRLHKTLENTRFKDCPVIAVAAKPGGPEAPETEEHQGVPDLMEVKTLNTLVCSGSRCVGPCRVTAWVCVTQFGPKLLERGVVCTPASLHTLHAAHISFHITVGHETVLARVTFFGLSAFSLDREFFHQDEYVIGQWEAGGTRPDPKQWALLEFERPVTCPPLCLVIGSKLDTDIHANACRLAFQGRLLEGFEEKSYSETTLPRLRIYMPKRKEGAVERVSGCPARLSLTPCPPITLHGSLSLLLCPLSHPSSPSFSLVFIWIFHCWWYWSVLQGLSSHCAHTHRVPGAVREGSVEKYAGP
uniref:Eukaryotic elongation factor, selenocysteine-tRNA-specific n=1 Tax=Oncorhynchus kisutch TaxID=8019 RepID=A0A8C7CY15_ONCKI